MGVRILYQAIWRENIRRLLAESKLSVAEAARLVGTSKQYLSAILAETEPTSMRERIIERLSLLLHANPDRLFTPPGTPLGTNRTFPPAEPEEDTPLTPVEQAVLAERNFLAHQYNISYALVIALLKRHHDELAPAAVAQAELLAGKSACLYGNYVAAEFHLARALSFWRKRMTAQPTKYLSPCLDTYRYLALAAHLAGDQKRALQLQMKALALYSKFPFMVHDLSARWEAIALSALRTATRISLGVLRKTADELLVFCDLAELTAFGARVRYEASFYQYAIGRATVPVGIPCEPPSPASDLWLAVCYGMALWESQEKAKLSTFAQDVALDTPSPDQRFVQTWLTRMADPHGNHVQFEAEDSPVSRALTSLARACQAAAQNDAHLALHAWQNALFELLRAREYPLYFLAYAGGLRQFPLTDDYRETLQADLARRVNVYEAKGT